MNNISEVPLFLSVIGLNTYTLLESLTAPENPIQKKLPELIKVLLEHLKPKRVVSAERFKFNQCNQKPNESIAEYVVELKKLATTCEFGEYLNNALCDRLVCGLKCVQMQEKLLAKQGLTLTEAIEITTSMKTAKQSLNLLREFKVQNDVHVNNIMPDKKEK